MSYSLTRVTAGDKIVDTDVNLNFATIEGALNSFPGGNIQVNTVPGDRLKTKTVTGAKLLDSTLTAAQLASNCVTTPKVLDANITVAKLASDSVSTIKVIDAAITAAKLAYGIAKTTIGSYTGVGGTFGITGFGAMPVAVFVFRIEGG